MKFQYFTYFLNPIDQKTLFPKSVGKNKNAILLDILSLFENKALEYDHHKTKTAFVVVRIVDNYVLALLGKKSSLKISLPPNKRFAEDYKENWPHCNVIFNLDDDAETGQKVIFEYKTYIFQSPHNQLKNLAERVNVYLLPYGYVLSINPVTVEQEFWKIVSEYDNRIERLSLSFNTPNLFNLRNSLESDLKKAQEEYHATKASIELENPEGQLKVPKNKLTEESVEYITKGGGEYKLKVKGRARTIISSKGKIKTKEIEDFDINIITSKQKTLFSILDRIFK